MADGKQLCRLLFQKDGKIYSRNQLLNQGVLEELRRHLAASPTGIRIDLGQGEETLVHAEATGDRT